MWSSSLSYIIIGFRGDRDSVGAREADSHVAHVLTLHGSFSSFERRLRRHQVEAPPRRLTNSAMVTRMAMALIASCSTSLVRC